MANEFAIIILNYHLISLTDFVLDGTRRSEIGYSMIALVCLVLVVNLGIHTGFSIKKVKRRYELKKEKAENIKAFLK